tara:strand:- start:440 stop:631 length:192 start_codon:yes stop_codon:yes gene_type:complete
VQITLGDITNDGTIDVLDIVTIINIILDNTEPSEYQNIAADINQDNIINVQDAILLINIILSR